MTFAVCVPFRGGDPAREVTWAFLRERWQSAGFAVYSADGGDPGRFSAAAARNAAAGLAGVWDAALLVDADLLLDPGQARSALDLAAETGDYVAAYDRYCWLDAATASAVLAGGEPPEPDLASETLGDCWIGAVAVRRDLWDRLGGYDTDRFAGVGGEDVNFFARALERVGCRRVEGPVYHLWHPAREGRWT